MDMKKLHEILDKHAKWLNNKIGGVRANLQGADLHDVNLQYANLQGADLWGADLRYADLLGTNLQGSSLQCSNLEGANLQGADLWGADLQGANLQGADLHDASLSWVNWHETKGIRVYVAGLQSSRENAQLTYIPSIDIATTGCWQGSWQETIEQIHSVYDEGTRECKAYDLAIEYIENQMELDGAEDE